MKRRSLLAGLALGLGGLSAIAAPQAPVPAPRPAQAASSAAALVVDGAALKSELAPTGRSGWMVVDLDSGEILERFAAAQGFAPASVAKVPTTLYALDRLGPEHRFETRVLASGRQTGETLEGDLILEGGGDPELDSDGLLPLVTQARAQGFRTVRGRFLVDGSLGPMKGAIDDDQTEDAAYNPSSSGRNLNFNRVRVKWTAKGIERRIRVSAKAQRLDPDVDRVKVLISEERAPAVFRYELDGAQEVWRVTRRALSRPGARWLPVRLPELYAGDVFRGIAETYGIALGEPALGRADGGQLRVVARRESRALKHILRAMLRYSTNLTAEAVGVAAGERMDREVPFTRQLAESGQTRITGLAPLAPVAPARAPDRPLTLRESAERMNRWAARFVGFEEGDPEFRLINHSGLTIASRVSPRRMVALLCAAARVAPLAGQARVRLPGQLAGLLEDYNIAAKSVALDYKAIDVAAKTGTMDFVRGLAGYAATPKGRRFAFAIFSNDLARRGETSRRTQRSWTARAKVFERALLRGWMQRFDAAPGQGAGCRKAALQN